MTKRLYMVQASETLKSIAGSQLGEESRWQELAYINSLEQPYYVSPGQLILLPSDDQPLEIVIKKYGQAPQESDAALPKVDLQLSPAELGLLAGGVVFLWWLWKG